MRLETPGLKFKMVLLHSAYQVKVCRWRPALNAERLMSLEKVIRSFEPNSDFLQFLEISGRHGSGKSMVSYESFHPKAPTEIENGQLGPSPTESSL